MAKKPEPYSPEQTAEAVRRLVEMGGVEKLASAGVRLSRVPEKHFDQVVALLVPEIHEELLIRLRLYGGGELARHLALEVEPILDAATFTGLPKQLQAQVNDPEVRVEVRGVRGETLHKKIGTLTRDEWARVFDRKRGFLSAKQQKR